MMRRRLCVHVAQPVAGVGVTPDVGVARGVELGVGVPPETVIVNACVLGHPFELVYVAV
jgi:hypothetical protein